MYTKAIEIDPNNSIYYANRSLANLRCENFGYALNDSVMSVKSDPSYLKAYYRRAAAHMSLGKFKLALSDFEIVSNCIIHNNFIIYVIYLLFIITRLLSEGLTMPMLN